MPNYDAKLSSAYLNVGKIRSFIDLLPSVIREIYGTRNLTAFYGFDCNLHQDLCYKPMIVSPDAFPYFIEDSIEQRIYEVGATDLLIKTPDLDASILLCHEADIHLDGENESVIEAIASRFRGWGFRSADQWKEEYGEKK